MAKKTGAPTKYKPEYCEQIIEFFNKEPFEYVEIDVEDENGEVRKTIALDKSGNPIRVPVQLPTKAAFAISIGVDRDSLRNWAREHPEFFGAIKICEMMQENILTQNALVQAYDKTFSIFTAKNVMGWTDKGSSDFVNIDFKGCNTAMKKAEKVISEIACGSIPLDKGKTLLDALMAIIKIDEATDLKDRLEAIEKALNAKSE